MSTPIEDVITNSKRLRAETRRFYLSVARMWLDFAGKDMRRWTGALVEKWRDAMEAKKLGSETINGRIYALRFAGGRLEGLGKIDKNFAAGAETLPPTARRTRRPIDEMAQARLFGELAGDAPADLRDRAITTLMLRTGVRVGKPGVGGLLNLKIGDVEAAGMTVVLKGGKVHRTPPLDPDTVAAVEAWQRWLAGKRVTEGYLFRSIRSTLDGVTVGNALQDNAVRKMFVARSKRAGVRHIHPHLFRHTFVSECRSRGVPDWQIALYTGHTTVIAGAAGGGGAVVPTLTQYTGDVTGRPLPLPPLPRGDG